MAKITIEVAEMSEDRLKHIMSSIVKSGPGRKKVPRRSWTEEEDKLVLDNYQLEASKIKKFLPQRSTQAIATREWVLFKAGKVSTENNGARFKVD